MLPNGRITFVRHATTYTDTEGNKRVDTPGKELAARRGSTLDGIDRVVVSAADRAKDTFDAMNINGVFYTRSTALAEMPEPHWSRFIELFVACGKALEKSEPTPAELMAYSQEAAYYCREFGKAGAGDILHVLEIEPVTNLLVVGHDFGTQLIIQRIAEELDRNESWILEESIPHCGGYVVTLEDDELTIEPLDPC